ncbi:MAG: methyl-accepting chemotaxis protein [Proteobacteria bacterium]|nr:methyl-accepting chemotaxis protein [Pseudomonadota bacterium]
MKKYFNRLKILHKIIISGLIFALPICILLYYMISGFNNNIDFARMEIWGSRLLTPLTRLAELIPEHQLLVRLYLQGDTFAQEKIDVSTKKIDESFAILIAEGKKYEKVLRIDEKSLKAREMEKIHYSKVYKIWQELNKNCKNNSTVQNDIEHEMVLQPIQALIKRLGDTSNMVLDPDLDSLYMMDVAIVTMPKTLGKLSEFLLFGESVIFKGFRSREDIVKFSVFAAMMEEDLERVRQNIATALREDKNYYGSSNSLQANMPPSLSQYESFVTPFLVVLKRFANDPDSRISVAEFLEPARTLLEAGAQLREVSLQELQILLSKRIDNFSNKKLIALSLSLIALILAAIIILIISRGITRSLGKVIDIAGEIAAGNLQQAVESLETMGKSGFNLSNKAEHHTGQNKNEIVQLFQAISTMTSGLDALLTQVRKSGIQVTSSSTQIAAAARQLEATVAEQASSINEVSATSKEISATAQEFAKTMNRVAEMSSRAADLASASMTSLSDINATMKILLENTTESFGKLRTVDEKMGNITQVITTITKVANQINLLSLNAAIEAEKAGEYGTGFSVVAREIRRLADQTAVAAIDIEVLIIETQGAMKEGMSAVETYTDQTMTSTEKIAEISVDLLMAIEHTQELAPQFESANQGMQVQSQSAAQISEAMGQLNESAKQTRDSLVEFKGVTEQLNEAVRDLQNEVARFSISS